jgi:bacteriorhodopsin
MERVVVGMMVANMMMATMMAYAWYMVGRVFELIILWLGSIIVAFKDDGEGTQFRIIMKAVVNKTLSIIFIELVFTITNVLINMGFMKALMNNAAQTSTG